MKLTFINCFWLLVPLFLWNAIFIPKLTQAGFASDADVPRWNLVLEVILRVAVFALPLLLPLQWNSALSKTGLALYLAGVLIYFGSWLPLVY